MQYSIQSGGINENNRGKQDKYRTNEKEIKLFFFHLAFPVDTIVLFLKYIPTSKY